MSENTKGVDRRNFIKAMAATGAAAAVGGKAVAAGQRDVPDPVGLRYLYAEPWFGSLMNEVGLPLGPFHIDARSAGVK